MTNITLQKQHRTLWHFIPGLALSAVITGVALWGGSIPAVAGAGFSALTLAILLGMVLGNTIYPHIWKSCDGGVLFAKQYLLRLGIILYGFRLTFSQIADVGISGIIIDVLTLSSTFLLACFLGQKVFGLDKHTSWLIGAGNSICGAAAVLATEPVVKAEASKVTVAVATGNDFSAVARSFNKANINAEIQHRLHHVLAIPNAKFNRQLRIIMAITGDNCRQNVVTDGTTGIDTNRAVVFAKQLFDFNRLFKQCQRTRIEQPPVFINNQSFPHAIKQLHAKLPFQVGQGCAHC